jgi:hypothetical protein
MRASLRMIFLSFVIVMVMGLGTNARAQYGTEEKPAEQAGAAKPAGKMIPEDLTADFNLSFYSQYIWRGLELSRDSVVFFPTLTVGYKGFAVNLWADLDTNFGTGNEERHFKLQETDVTVSYSNSYQGCLPWNLNYTLGWILYDYQPTAGEADQTIKDTKNQEVFLSLGLDTLLKPTFTVYNEIETGQALYLSLGLSHSFAVYKDWSLDVGGWVSYLENHSTAHFSNFHDGNISAGLNVPLNNYLSIKPNIQYSFPLSGDAAQRIRDNSEGLFHHRQDNFVYGGIIMDLAI